ncbi:carboxypeptidase-like regulatory domain-containing protein [Engelhardtia mirabilis]|uniref:Uncharacterized protein n=1 Tax=Engelhardtia mirabilis TaxID=2528011 RepID=A0A518BRZ2_9BACT|nr:hypothetical protein Pla133_48520 [Planctomycetes bacterium Pla133]QDV04056.1 hypothetical protein Pla86_48500 [Planctomycetes bacterium Pla86]
MGKSLWILAAIGVLLGVALWTLAGPQYPLADASSAPNTGSTGPEQPASSEASNAFEPLLRRPDPVAGTAAGSRVHLDVGEAGAREVDVELTDRIHGLPVAGVEIEVVQSGAGQVPAGGPSAGFRLEPPRHGRVPRMARITDLFGRARVAAEPGEGHFVLSVARRRAFVGTAELESDSPLRVEVDSPPSLPLRLVGPDGRPVVGALAAVVFGPDRVPLGRAASWGFEPSDPFGVAPALFNTPSRTGPFAVAVRSLGIESAGPPVDPMAFEGEPLAAALPPHGSILIAVRDADGALPAPGQGLVLRCVESDEELWGRVDDQGQYRQAVVGLGLHFEIRSHAEARTLAGPVADGEEVAVNLVGVGRRVRLTGRLVGPDVGSAELSAARFALSYRLDGEAHELDEDELALGDGDEVRVDKAGQFVLGGLEQLPDGFEGAELRVFSSGFRLACAPVPAELGVAELGRDELNLGDLTLVPSGVTTGGQLLPAPGQVLETQLVTLRRGEGEELEFARCDDEGRFVLTHMPFAGGSLSGAQFSVGRQFWPAEIGSLENVLQLEAGGSIDVRLEGAHEEIPAVARLELCLLDGQGNLVSQRKIRMGGDIRFELDRAGSFDLWVRSNSNADIYQVVEGIEVEPGQVVRLDPLRVGVGLREVEVHVADSQGRPIRNAHVSLELHGSSGATSRTMGSGRTTVLAAPQVERLVVRAPGYRTAATRLVSNRIDIHLPAALEVSIAPPEQRITDDANFGGLSLRHTSAGRSLRCEFDSERGVWSGHLSETGTYSIVMRDDHSFTETEILRFDAPESGEAIELRLNDHQFSTLFDDWSQR